MPGVLNIPVSIATRALNELGMKSLNVEVQIVPASEAAPGIGPQMVLAQIPSPGSHLTAGTTVILRVQPSSGPAPTYQGPGWATLTGVAVPCQGAWTMHRPHVTVDVFVQQRNGEWRQVAAQRESDQNRYRIRVRSGSCLVNAQGSAVRQSIVTLRPGETRIVNFDAGCM
jgi:hypothetical protein